MNITLLWCTLGCIACFYISPTARPKIWKALDEPHRLRDDIQPKFGESAPDETLASSARFDAERRGPFIPTMSKQATHYVKITSSRQRCSVAYRPNVVDDFR